MTRMLCVESVHVIARCDPFAHAHLRIGEAPAVRAGFLRNFLKLVRWHNDCAFRREIITEESCETKKSFDSSRNSHSGFNRIRHRCGANVGYQATEPGDNTPRHLSAGNFKRRNAVPAQPVGTPLPKDSPFSGTVEMGRANSPQDVKAAQEALQEKGHNPGPIDGMMGPRTREALKSFNPRPDWRRRDT